MASKKVYEAIAVIGEYQDKSGNTKKRYQRCGVVFENERGLSLKLEAIPVGSEWNGWLMLMEPRESQGGGVYNAPAAREQTRDEPPFDDDVPFATSAGIW